MTASRTSRRPGAHRWAQSRLAMAALAAGVGAVLSLAGCSAGRITQTDTQVAPVPGIDAQAGEIALRNMVIQYDGPEGYPAGGDAPLVVRLFNNGTTAVTLTGVTADKAAAVNLVGTPTVVTPTETPSIPPSASPTGEGSPSPTGSPTPTASPTSAPPAAGPVSVTIPGQSFVLLVPGEGDAGHLVLTGLTEAIAPGEFATVTFTFDNGSTAVATVPLAPPTDSVPRATPVVEPGHAEPGH